MIVAQSNSQRSFNCLKKSLKPHYFFLWPILVVNPCSSLPCLNGGDCNLEGDEFSCTCAPGFAGDFCESKFISDICVLCIYLA